ncbi:probable ATP-dependent RNA helicase DHX34 [Acanthaster planci]|uniref:Probable ATP-dependent RNA helicase DHX34 n=1 Tax=Acanthaster planci TaxID=133434 RepID=A0A8B7YJE0_ACAPL|nr:probable ATP-dependent RNA helicase DHX34 [Acanthaster planci]XP_022092526.1 probable ATP-dependent RNA helicase DHX34 [Acanthaster planci]
MESRKSTHSSHHDRSHDRRRHKHSERERQDERRDNVKKTSDCSHKSRHSRSHKGDRSSDPRHRTEKYHDQSRVYQHSNDDGERESYSHSESYSYSSSTYRSRDPTRPSSRREDETRTETGRRSKDGRKRTSKAWSYFGYTADDIPLPDEHDKSSRNVEPSGKNTDTITDRNTGGLSARAHQDRGYRSLGMQGSRAESDRCPDEKAETARDSDGIFDWKRHRRELDAIFFRDDSIIQRKSEDYQDFWKFLERYQAFQFKQSARQPHQDKSDADDKDGSAKSAVLGLPLKYDKRHRINMALDLRGVEEAERRLEWLTSSQDDEDELSTARIKEFSKVLLYYMDFCQKQQFAKLAKLLRDRANLPIARYQDMIVEATRANQVVIVAGDTGCGKSTQVPQYLMKAGFKGIACTQPRRIACISLSKRVGYETLHEYGMEVGYQIRFEASKSAATKILFLTEGLLLRQLSLDPTLQQYNVIILDEVHERHLHGDFLLGVLRCLLEQRQDLKLVLMSATINIGLFSGYFDKAPVIQVPGRLFPIKLEYAPISIEEQSSKSEKLDPRPYLRIMQQIDMKYPATERGDLLIFLSGMSEISSVVEAAKLYAATTQTWIVLALHSTLSIAEQDKVFDVAPEGVRKCIVSTNIAETSVTIDGIRFIVDSGKVKEMSYNAEAKMQQLQEFWISRASAEQRKGRAGRTGPGVCFRLYEESRYSDFQEYSTPEIHRVPLDSLILQMMALGLHDPRKFPFIEPPPATSIESSILFLKEQRALSKEERLTPIGRLLADLPVDVVIGKMLIMATIFKMIEPVLCIAAALSVQSPFTSRAHRSEAMTARCPLESDHGDPFTLLNAFDEWIQVKAKGLPALKWCKRRGLEEQRFYEMSKLKRQFEDLLRDHNLVERLSDPSERKFSSAERYQRNLEKKKLRELKRKEHSGPKKRKLLRLGQENFDESGDDEDEPGSDLKSLEFKLTHDLNRLQTAASLNRSFTLRELNLLKVILCSGLYPQLAIADDCNTYRRECDQVFHTKAKPFVLLHPTGVFANNPSILEPPEEKDEAGNACSRGVRSSRHQLIAYVSLLETNKPYLVNTMRVPALQTMLLYANCLDTNQACTRIVVDEWIELTIADVDTAEHVMSAVIQLRAAWLQLLEMRLQDTKLSHPDESTSVSNLRVLHQERLLSSKLAEFLDCHVEYTMRKLGSTELQNLYLGPHRGQGSEGNKDDFFTSQSRDGKIHPTKGGTQVNDYLTFGCLYNVASDPLGEFSSVIRRHWTCPHCTQTLIITTLEKLQHEAECLQLSQAAAVKKDVQIVAENASDHGNSSDMATLRRQYQCPICNEEFSFTSSEILKHKRMHAKETSRE